ncbi:hypothetical protein FA15DRAFT_675480 [Coprinopsis marcescibilis]|uniref:Uncharacterized protein n=1 Tax=Coprinopsis marcescibilis TaxID=230819 RepID=A0A5C3KE07_COPMA|nr:hypothetical protein FA15DRAFT_675480 [Coprinopsis marcescibilis]
MPLRPALKTELSEADLDSSSPLPFASTARMLDSPRVHFPPTPTLVSVALTHSPISYDRAPIQVTPNTCALPERGARTYSLTEDTEDMSSSSYTAPWTIRPRPGRVIYGRSGEGHSSPLASDLYDIISSPSMFLHTFSSESEDTSEGMSGLPGSPIHNSKTMDANARSIEHASLLLSPEAKKGKNPPRKSKTTAYHSSRNVSYGLQSSNDPDFEGCLGGF